MAEGDQFRREPHIDKRIAERCIEQPLTQFLQAVGRDLFLVVLGNVTADRADKSTAFIDSKHSAYITKKPEYLEYPKIFATAGERLIIVTENVTRSAAAENAKYLNRYGMELKPNFPDPTSEIPGTTFEIADLLSLHGLSNREIMYALLSGHLHVDLTKEAISPKTTVHRGTGSKNHLEIFPL